MQRNYRHTKDVLRHSVVYKKRRKLRVVKIVLFFILFLCILVGLVFLIRIPTFTISEIQVKNLQSASTQDVINEVESKLVGSYAFIFPKKNIFFYPKGKLKEDLLNKYSTFASVEIGVADTNKLEITITEKNAAAVSCQTEEAIISNSFDNCFFVDYNAKAFQPVLGLPDQSLTRFVDANVNSTSSINSSTTLDQLQKVMLDLNDKNFRVQYIKIIDSKDVEFQIEDNGKIMVSLPIAEDFISILNTALNTKSLSSDVIFEYIDARFGNKVFFKLNN